MNISKKHIVLLLFFLTTISTPYVFAAEQQDSTTDDIYTTVLNLLANKSEFKQLIVYNETGIDNILDTKNMKVILFEHLVNKWPTLKKETYDSFLLKNKYNAPVNALIKTKKPTNIVNEKTINSFFSTVSTQKGWEAFYTKFPGAFGKIRLSQVGFDKDTTQAIVYIGHLYGRLSGTGSIFFLKRKGSKWVIFDVIEIWVS